MNYQLISSIGTILIITGFLVTILALLLMFLSPLKRGERKISGGGVILIGPIPLIFATERKLVKALTLISIILIALMLIYFLILH